MADESQKSHYEKKYSNFKALPNYDLEYRKFHYRFKNLITDNNIHIDSSSRLLDLGCAFGVKTYMMSDFFQYTKGIDFIENSIAVAKLLNDNPKLEFEVEDVSVEVKEDVKYNFITAFGLSIFNKKQIDAIVQNIQMVAARFGQDKFTLILGSETDFSGTSPSGWHYHSKQEILSLQSHLINLGYKVHLYYPHKKSNNYSGRGIAYWLYESLRLFSSAKREYFLIIEKN